MNTTTPARQYGWKRPQRAPPSSLRFNLRNKVRATNPTKVDLRPKDGPIENQGPLGSCTSFGWGGATRFADHNAPVATPKLSLLDQILIALHLKAMPKPVTPTDVAPSHLFIYFNERELEGTTGDDAGASVSDGAKVISTLGVPPESSWSYDVSMYASRPSAEAYALAKQHVYPAPASVDNSSHDEVRTALANGHPVVFGFDVYASFESIGTDGVYAPSGGYQGGHCVCAVGYDDELKLIIVRNSWGTDWGDKGYFYMPYAVFTNTNMTTDAWALTDATSAPASTESHRIGFAAISPATIKVIEHAIVVALVFILTSLISSSASFGPYGPVIGSVATILLSLVNSFAGHPVAALLRVAFPPRV